MLLAFVVFAIGALIAWWGGSMGQRRSVVVEYALDAPCGDLQTTACALRPAPVDATTTPSATHSAAATAAPTATRTDAIGYLPPRSMGRLTATRGVPACHRRCFFYRRITRNGRRRGRWQRAGRV